MGGLPAEFAPRFFATERLVPRKTSRPFAEFASNGLNRHDLRLLFPRTRTAGKGAGDPAYRDAIVGPADVARSGRSAFKCQGIELCEVVCLHQRPALGLARDHPYRMTIHGVARESIENAAVV